MKGAKNNDNENYSEMLESYYNDLVEKDKAGRISRASHQALETFLQELRELVAEVDADKLRKAA